MKSFKYEVKLPAFNEKIEQDEEWLTVNFGEKEKRIRFHNYGEIYKIPGLYEEIFYTQLKCNSPNVVCGLLHESMKKSGRKIERLRVLDFGAGNGMFGEEIQRLGAKTVVGVDILNEAKRAAFRDRPGIYKNYFVMDMTKNKDRRFSELKDYNFNALATVGSLGFGDIPPLAFINAFNLVSKGGWIAFNIKDMFVSENDETGYSDIFDILNKDHLGVLNKKRYCHRLSISGEKLFYVAFVCRKKKSVDLSYLKEEFSEILKPADQRIKAG